MILTVVIAILLFTSLFFECYGFMFRLLGAMNSSSSLGYSIHVQVATLARFGTLIAYPLIAYQLETGITNKELSLIPIVTYILLSIFLLYFSKKKNSNKNLVTQIFRIVSRFSGLNKELWIIDLKLESNDATINSSDRSKIIYFGTFAFLFTSASFFLTSIVANQFLEYRTTIIQCTPFISAIGTMMSVIYFDPIISKLIDENPKSINIIILAWKARIRGSILISILFALINIFL